MSNTLTEIAQQLVDASTDDPSRGDRPKKVQLIYAFNGTGKTRLSREFKQLIAPVNGAGAPADDDAREVNDETGDAVADTEETELSRNKILYYNAFTEDLFYWDNDLAFDSEPKLKIQPNSFTDWILIDQGQDQNIATNFQRYVDDRLTPRFAADFREVTFSIETGDDDRTGNLKISKGEESNFIWSVFYTLLDQVITILNVAEPDERDSREFDNLEYVFIDDPVSSLDENHVIELAVDLAELIRSNESDVKFVISTHNPVFYNVLCNELGSDDRSRRPNWRGRWFSKSRLERTEDGRHELVSQPNDSPFAYHLHLLSHLRTVIEAGQIEKYHFSLLRNVLEKTATFLGHKRWEHLLPQLGDGRPNPYAKRILNFSSHSKHSADEVPILEPEDKMVLQQLIDHIVSTHRFWQEEGSDD